MNSSELDVYREGLYHEVINKGLVGKQMAFFHKLIERPYKKSHFRKILEIGAGIGEHLPYVRASWNEYVMTDIRIDRLLESVSESADIKVKQADATQLPFDNNEFDRVLTTCVLPHVSDPVRALSEVHRVIRPGGSISIYIPCEPGLLLRVARRLSTSLKFRKLGVADPYFEHFREHVHYYSALNHYILREFRTSTVRARYWPFPFLTWNFNLVKIYQISIPSEQPTE